MQALLKALLDAVIFFDKVTKKSKGTFWQLQNCTWPVFDGSDYSLEEWRMREADSLETVLFWWAWGYILYSQIEVFPQPSQWIHSVGELDRFRKPMHSHLEVKCAITLLCFQCPDTLLYFLPSSASQTSLLPAELIPRSGQTVRPLSVKGQRSQALLPCVLFPLPLHGQWHMTLTANHSECYLYSWKQAL